MTGQLLHLCKVSLQRAMLSETSEILQTMDLDKKGISAMFKICSSIPMAQTQCLHYGAKPCLEPECAFCA